MNQRNLRIILISVGILIWVGLATHSYLSVWQTAAPTYRQASISGKFMMHIKGEVNTPGLYEFERGDTYEDIILAAGGFTESADPSSVDLSALCVDGTELSIPKTTPVPGDSTVSKGKSSSKSKTGSKKEVVLPLDINQASKEELCALSGIGEVLAGRIVDYREQNGPFTSVEELLNVSGIGEKKLEAIRQDVYITPSSE